MTVNPISTLVLRPYLAPAIHMQNAQQIRGKKVFGTNDVEDHDSFQSLCRVYEKDGIVDYGSWLRESQISSDLLQYQVAALIFSAKSLERSL